MAFFIFVVGCKSFAQNTATKNPLIQSSKIRLELIRDCLIPTEQKFQGFEIRGLSAIHYDERSKVFHLLSDSKNPLDPQLFQFKLEASQFTIGRQQFPCPVPVRIKHLMERLPLDVRSKKESEQRIAVIETDAESIAFDSDGSFFVSSEIRTRGEVIEVYPEIIHFSKEGVKLGGVTVPAAYIPKIFRIPPGPEPVPREEPIFTAPVFPSLPKPKKIDGPWVPDFFRNIIQWIQQTLWQKKVEREKAKHDRIVSQLRERHHKLIFELRERFQKAHKQWEDNHVAKTAGVEFNNVIEAIGFDKESRYLTAFVESSLTQDQIQDRQLIRALRMKLDLIGRPTETKEFFYRADPSMRISEILDLGRGQILVLEITYDPSLAKVFSRIYEVQMDPNLGVESKVFLVNQPQILKKQLVLDLNRIEFRLNPHYPRLDNLEGMSLGPILPSGHRSLILVSDNNGNYNQTTQFLIFRLETGGNEVHGTGDQK